MDKIDNSVMEQIPGNLVSTRCMAEEKNVARYTSSFFKTLNLSGLQHTRYVNKNIGASIMKLRKLNIARGIAIETDILF